MTSEAPSTAARYDRALKWAHERGLPPDAPRPLPTSAWPDENVALLDRYRDWLVGGGFSQAVIDVIYLPMAGHVLGLTPKPHHEIDLAADLEAAMDYVEAKRLSAQWTDNCRKALAKFRTFLKQEQGILEVKLPAINYARHCEGLPDWLVTEMERYQLLMQRNWRPRCLVEQARNFWSVHTRLWRYLFERYPVRDIGDIKRQHLLDYVGHMLGAGYAASSVNAELRYFRGFLLFLQDREYLVPRSLLRLPSVRQPDTLPRFLTDEQVRLLRDDLDRRFEQARSRRGLRDAALDRGAVGVYHLGAVAVGVVAISHRLGAGAGHRGKAAHLVVGVARAPRPVGHARYTSGAY